MRIGFDLDGTLADLHAALARESAVLFPDVDPDDVPSSAAPDDEGTPGPEAPKPKPMTGGLSARQQRELWASVCEQVNFWETLDEIVPGSLARLFRLARDRRWEIIFLTSRPETRGDTAQLQSHRWLSAHGFDLPSVFVVHGSRGKIASSLRLDVVVDDRPENCLDVAIDSSARPILICRADENTLPASARQLGIGAVHSIAECIDLLEQLDTPDAEQTGVMERLKRLLGLKSRSARLGDVSPSAAARSGS
jgi:hypothetical protein